MSDYESPHLIVEDGADRGREIVIPESGARMGRAHENDIVLNDPSLSRFQCRLFFKDNDLWVADLGSANGSLVNGKEVHEQALVVGDELIIGETSIRVVHTTLNGAPSVAASGASAAPLVEKIPSAESVDQAQKGKKSSLPSSVKEIDLGLKRKVKKPVLRRPGDGADEPGGEKEPRHVPAVLWMVAIIAILAAVVVVVVRVLLTPSGGGPPMQPEGDNLAIYYEKVQASPDNIFRYEMLLDSGKLKVTIDNLDTDQHLTEEGDIDDKVLASLRSNIRDSRFFELNEEYDALAPNTHDVKDITITMGHQVHRSRVVNRIDPEIFLKVRELLENFGQTQLGLVALALPPEKLRQFAEEAYQLANDLYEAKNVQHDNLWTSMRAYKDVEIHLRTLDPKPDYYDDAIVKYRTCRTEIQERFENNLYQADRAITLRDWEMAVRYLKMIRAQIPDRGDERNDSARQKLLEAERNLDR
jgi:hypothetical protein